jgi:hypothetical protein
MMVVRPKWCRSAFNVNFNISFNILLDQYNCAFSWINKEPDNINLHETNVKKSFFSALLSYSIVLFHFAVHNSHPFSPPRALRADVYCGWKLHECRSVLFETQKLLCSAYKSAHEMLSHYFHSMPITSKFDGQPEVNKMLVPRMKQIAVAHGLCKAEKFKDKLNSATRFRATIFTNCAVSEMCLRLILLFKEPFPWHNIHSHIRTLLRTYIQMNASNTSLSKRGFHLHVPLRLCTFWCRVVISNVICVFLISRFQVTSTSSLNFIII